MREEGIVIDTYGEFARVEAERNPSCEGCMSKGTCKPASDSSMIVEAVNLINAKVGDRVNFEIDANVLLKSTFIIYILPVIFLLSGAFIGGELADMLSQSKKKETLSVVGGGIFFIIGIILLMLLNKYFSRKKGYKPVIREILSTGAG